MSSACGPCLARTWLLERLSMHIERVRARVQAVLALGDAELISAVAGADARGVARQLLRFEPAAALERSAAAGLEVVCRCDPGYPDRLRELAAPPAVLHVAGGLGRLAGCSRADPVAVVGARRASDYGAEVSRSLGHDLAAAGITTVSGMARGIDAAAHQGALDAAGPTIAVLPGSAQRPYPAGARRLHARIVADAVAVSELGPEAVVRRWNFTARNRTIAALAGVTVVVEATARSGALVTARIAAELGRPVAAVPGRVTSPHAEGPNGLLATGAAVVRGAQDVLDLVYGVGVRSAPEGRGAPADPIERALLAELADGGDTEAAIRRAGIGPDNGLAALAALELTGRVRRGVGGRYTVVP